MTYYEITTFVPLLFKKNLKKKPIFNKKSYLSVMYACGRKKKPKFKALIKKTQTRFLKKKLPKNEIKKRTSLVAMNLVFYVHL